MELLSQSFKFCGGICERALEIFWQECTRIYEERRSRLDVSILPVVTSKPQCTAKNFSTRTISRSKTNTHA